MEKWRLGLDLGTNSIGWCVLGLDKESNPVSLINMGTRIFSDGREPKTGEPLAVARRLARGIRKNLRRRKQRRRQLFAQLQADGLYPSDGKAAAALKTMDPYNLRVEALDRVLQPQELGRALFHLGVRRGFKSNRKDSSEEDIHVDANEVKQTDATKKMSQGEKCLSLMELVKGSQYRSLGEFLLSQKNSGAGTRFVPERSNYYPLRQLYEEEFTAIRNKQESSFPGVHWDDIHRIIFTQRPLRKQERGKCQFIADKERSFKAMPSSHRFRILQEVLNLIMYDNRNTPVSLLPEQQDVLIKLLDEKEKVSFDAMRKKLKIEHRFNLESDIRTELNGNKTALKLRSEKAFGAQWDALSLQAQDDIVEALITASEDSDILEMLGSYRLAEAQKAYILGLRFSAGTTNLCKELTQTLVAVMQEKRLQYDKALLALGIRHSEVEIAKHDILPYYGKLLPMAVMGAKYSEYGEDRPELKYGKIANPTVHIALNQVRVIINSLIKKYGKPAQIVIELSRELKESRDEKDRKLKLQKKNKVENERLNVKISGLTKIQYPSRHDRLFYKLWEELGYDDVTRRCLYCGKTISAAELFTGNIEIEHILPFSRTLLDSESNLTVAHKQCNAIKRERSPFEAFGNNPKGYNWDQIMERVHGLRNKVKAGRFAVDAMDVFDKESGFITRQLNDNRYLSKIARAYVTAICDDVWVVNGGMTKLLRDKWDIDSILKRRIGEEEKNRFDLKDELIGQYKKNRYDHRHHAIDALVIALTDRSMVMRVSALSGYSQRREIVIPPRPFPTEEIMDRLRNIVVSFKPDHGVQGKLSKETHLGRIKTEVKVLIEELTEMDIENIKIPRVKEEFEALIAERKDFRKAIKELGSIYPQVIIFRHQFVNRMPITSLKDEKNIKDIVDPIIRDRLRGFVEARRGEKFEKVLIDFSEQTGIKKLRCVTRIQAPIRIDPDPRNPLSVPRYLNPEDYFAAIVWEIPSSKEGGKPKYEAQYVRRTRVDKKGKPIEDRPHPAARKVCLLHKYDYIEFAEGGIWKKARVAGYSASQNKLDIRPIFATMDSADWVIATNDDMQEKGWKKIEGCYYLSVNVLFGELAARKITVSPIGEVRRKK